jgi:anthranilate/para-aminobenzoate synthase component II
MKPDGVFLSNGPGDPGPCDYAIAAAKEIIEKGIPTFGICLGHQIMGLAAGAKTPQQREWGFLVEAKKGIHRWIKHDHYLSDWKPYHEKYVMTKANRKQQ